MELVFDLQLFVLVYCRLSVFPEKVSYDRETYSVQVLTVVCRGL